ncbi:NADH-quinone oxidoreductase subunit NuoG [Methylobacter sp.]|uniref:NADH-quinone oxidoreductase subunit NuoG n=1 Tax=Methylobacter sp. TaxID=2051955 RepID=UPI002489E238|nr:NADH-quinone oxidoreductase subunit NuoG [Methylobacter sp.]MDI1279299.1 NADH-quinone oxidoreductase subunit NuoG [Methylobacter sp.]MDI1360066.1 NADH-quinone oxidoreductase subunit NuoG [Methylobacter sp.]
MARIEIDGQPYDVLDGNNLLSACLSLGLDLPYFCWHPALGSAGACRQCAVIQYKDAEDQRGRLVMACMTPVADAMRVSIAAEPARQFRSDNIELLMTNHPHDCPVCEEGGECHLQDMTVMTGHTFRRYRGLKRTHHNQNLGPFINHEMNRCIACYRCVRFYDDYAGGNDLQVFGMHNNVYFGRFEDGALESEFSGNLVEVCPTGVFTDKTFSAHYARKWDLQTAPSICAHCGLGCNTAPGERYGELRRVINRYNGEVNGYFLCDRGRFGYGFVNSPKRIRKPRLNSQDISAEAAESHFRQLLKADKPTIGIGSPRASLEANFALRTLVGEENFFLGLEDTEHTLLNAIVELMRHGGIHSPSLREVEQADAVLILGEDVTQNAPRLALSLRQAARNASFEMARTLHLLPWQDAAVRNLESRAQSPVFIASICATRLDDVAASTYRGSPEDIARLGFAIAHCLDESAPEPAALGDDEQSLASAIADSLKQAKRPLIVSGTSCSSLDVIQAAYNVAKALPSTDKQLTFTVSECNSLGLAIMGGTSLQQAFERIGSGVADSVIILENDLYRRVPGPELDRFLETAAHVVVIDSLENKTTGQAELLLPAAIFAESEGTWVNNEGRAQRYFPVYPAPEPVRGSWQWLAGVMDVARWRHHDALTAACANAFPDLASIIRAAPGADYTVKGSKIPRQPHRYSGRTAMHADIKVSEPGQPQDQETPFAFSMEGDTAQVLPALVPVIWAPGWNSNQAINKFQQQTGGHLRDGDPGVRLLEASGTLPWFGDIPPAFKPEQGRWRVMPLPHIFGTEELSLQSPSIAERLPAFCVLLNPLDAETLKVDSGDQVEISSLLGISILKIPVQIEPTLPQGLLGITAGLPAFQSMKNWAQVTLKKVNQEGRL